MSEPEYPENGIVYCATGKDRFLKEAYESIASLRKYDKNTAISLFVDNSLVDKVKKELFFSIHLIEHPEFGFGDKIYSMVNSPYKKTLYLDCDTILADEVLEIFKMLEVYDLAAINVPYKNSNYPDFNAGITAFKMNNRTKRFFKLWDERYDRIKHGTDQGTFKRLINQNIVIFNTLPPNYNLRMPFASFIIGKVKIFHSHQLNVLDEAKRRKIISHINFDASKERIWFPNRGIVILKKNLFTRILNRLEYKFYSLFNIEPENFLIFNRIRKKFIRFIFKPLLEWFLPKYYRIRIVESYRKIVNFK